MNYAIKRTKAADTEDADVEIDELRLGLIMRGGSTGNSDAGTKLKGSNEFISRRKQKKTEKLRRNYEIKLKTI